MSNESKIQACIFLTSIGIKMTKLAKEQWVEGGLSILREQGASELSIVKLSQRLSVTRGAFYYHFKSLNDFIDAMIAVWEENIIHKGFEQILTDVSDPRQEVKNLIEYVTHMSDRLDSVFRHWASSNTHVKEHMARLDQQRLSTVEGLFQRLANDKAKGMVLARIAYYGYIGSLHTYPIPSAQQQREHALQMLDLIMAYLEETK